MKNKLYEHVLNIQGVRHPITNYDGLNRAMDYILAQLDNLCDEVRCEEFYIDGFDKPFYNIDARIGTDENGPLLLLGSHYDTVYNSPGANDNGSAVAALLCLGEIFSKHRDKVNLRLLFFSLEEGNPVYDDIHINTSQMMGIKDDKGFYNTLTYQKDSRLFQEAFANARKKAFSFGEKYKLAYDSVKEQISPQMRSFYEVCLSECIKYKDPMGYGERALNGSSRWVDRHRNELKKCLGIINFDPVAYASSRTHSHLMTPEIKSGVETFNTDLENEVGNFIVAIGSPGSDPLSQSYLNGAKKYELPYAFVNAPFNYEETAYAAPYLLLSDHAAFWKQGIPALFLTDTGAEMRYFFEHTPADTIDKLDFDFFERVVLSAEFAISQLFGLK
ncbi:M28 family peptidase [Brevibacillus sp. SIMBA_040]|uniref:M28 family peptidase n=1 Tax=unclassified Brevibacillus TaxID=2684853 RepID=UPI00397A4FAD